MELFSISLAPHQIDLSRQIIGPAHFIVQVYATRAVLPQVKPNAPLPPQGFQPRPQGPPPSPRNSINNGPVGVIRPGQPLRRLDSRTSLGPPPASGQFVQLRPYGPPRPPGGSFPPRPPQPGQLPPQNPPYPPNQRFPHSPGIRGPPPQGVQRPPFIGNQQQQQQQQQQQRIINDPRFQRPDIAPQNGPPRPGQEFASPRQLLRNDSALSLQRQQLLSNEEIKQPTRPRIVIEKMADINESSAVVDKPEHYLGRKKSDVREDGDDDDDDVVMDREKSPQHNGAPDGLVNGSKSPLTPRKLDDASKPATRPGTATENKMDRIEDKQNAFSRPISPNIITKTTKEPVDESARLFSQSRPSSAINNEEERKEKDPRSDAFNVEQSLMTPPKSSDNSRSITPSQNAEPKTPSKTPDKSRSSTPAGLEPPGNAESKSPSKTPDKSRSSTPAGLEPPGNAEQESRTPSKTPDKSRSSTPAELEPPGNTGRESRMSDSKTPDKSRASTPAGLIERETLKTPARTPDKSRSSTPAGKSSNEISAESEVSETLHRDAEDTLQIKKSSTSASSLHSPNLDKGSKSSKSPRSPTAPASQDKLLVSGSMRIPPKSPDEGVRGFDNGQQRSLSSGSTRSPSSARSTAGSVKQTNEKKQTSFVEDLTSAKKTVEIADKMPTPRATSPSKPTTLTVKTPRAQTPVKSPDEKISRKSAGKKGIQNGSGSESQFKETDKGSTAGSPTKSPSKSAKSLPRTPDTPSATALEKKKVPMNKVQVGAAPSPNLKIVRSKIGSLDNASYKPGGGKVKIENRKLDFSKAQPKIAAKNDKYAPSGGDKKIAQVKLQWNAKSKIGSLENATYKPGGGDKKIETVKLDFKDKAKSKVGSKDNAKHIPGGGTVKSATPPKTPQETKNDIPSQKVDIKAESKIGSLDNVKHKPGGGDKKIFNDRDYLRQTSSNVESVNGSGSQSPVPSGAITDSGKNGLPASDENLNQEC
ncbi:microtubule-associated protein tau isoform X2 [Ooceraea biroi]|uniref:microtubule-associated protein tau isoform X2 n=1 Tax=Ooceraea biroi TaxID=2015173 RepID=UPI000F091E4A|nr:microtubule-associated protein tau isoform X2 [Ooceraea biroi]